MIAASALGGCVVQLGDGAAPEATDSRQGPDTAIATVDFAAPPAQVSVGVAGLSVDVLPSVQAEQRGGERLWVLRGRTDRDLRAVTASSLGSALGEARLVAPRSFQVAVRDGRDLDTLLSGAPLFVALDTADADDTADDAPGRYTLSVAVAPRFTRQEGSSAIVFGPSIAPVFVVDGATDLQYRAVVVAKGATALSLTGGDEGGPSLVSTSAPRWVFDWRSPGLAAAADPKGEPVTARADLAGGSATARAHVQLAVQQLGVTVKSPGAVWPSPACEEAVSRCLDEAPEGATDLAACGSYRQVAACR